MRVEFSDLALAGIRKFADDGSKHSGLKHSIAWYVSRHPHHMARRCPAFPDRDLFLFPLGNDMRILYEAGDIILVWSVLIAQRSP